MYRLINDVRLNTVDFLISLTLFLKSHEKGLITKEYIAIDTHLNFIFKWALHFSTYLLLTAQQSLLSCKCYSSNTTYEPVFAMEPTSF